MLQPQRLHMLSLKKKLTSSEGMVDIKMYKTGHLKTIWHCSLCYFKYIFLWSWTGFEVDVKTYYFDFLLELNKTPNPPPHLPEISKNKTQNWILKAGDQFEASF